MCAHKYFEGGYNIYNESQGFGGVWGRGEGVLMHHQVLKILKAPSLDDSQGTKFWKFSMRQVLKILTFSSIKT